jgi:hypothetical protein
VFRERELAQILQQQRVSWHLKAGTRVLDFIDLLLGATPLRAVALQPTAQARPLYCWGKVTVFEMAQHLRPRAYLSHHSALFLHGLVDLPLQRLYVNQEQSAKPPVKLPILTQTELDEAFARPVRLAQIQLSYGDYVIVQLQGKWTNRLGVIERKHRAAGLVALTSLERTLLDVTVRPEYAGGVSQVAQAYQRAADRVSISRLLTLLAKLSYRYPYHQAVGFYMARAGNYPPDQLELVRELGTELNFYLAHELRAPAYNTQWRVFYPADI